MLFADYLVQWLEIAKSTVKLTTYSSYKGLSESQIIPYFRSLGVTLGDLKAVHIQSFYQKQLERVKPNTVIHYHAIIHRALKYAVKTDLIDVNPADKVDRPKKNEFTGNFCSREEMNALFDAVRGNKIEVPVMLAAFYGLRRSEVVGLKWDAVDFEQNTLEIRHTVATVRLDGKKVIVESDTTKTKASKRTSLSAGSIRRTIGSIRCHFGSRLRFLYQKQTDICRRNWKHLLPGRTFIKRLPNHDYKTECFCFHPGSLFKHSSPSSEISGYGGNPASCTRMEGYVNQ